MKELFYKYSNQKDLIAIRTPSQKIYYYELFELSYKVSSNIKSLNLSSKYIPILASNSIEFVVTIISLWNLGLVPVPFNIRWTINEIKSIIERFQFEKIFYEKSFYEKITDLVIEKIPIDDLFDNKKLEKNNSKEEEAVVIFTSGSTGSPKGVVHTFNSLSNNVLNSSNALNLNKSDRWLALLPFYHIGGFQIICRTLISGSEIIIPDSLDYNSMKIAIEKLKPTHLSVVSTQIKYLIDNKIIPNKEIKRTFIGGGFFDDELIFKAYNIGWKPVRVYGSSETASMITSASIDDIKVKPNTVGKPFKNVNIIVSDKGEILISSNSLFKEYLLDEKTTKIKLKDGFYHSGDIGKIEDGYLFIEARRDDLIITGGENVNPQEVEQALLKIKGIKEAYVFGIDDEKWGHKVCAAIISDSNLSIDYINNILSKEISSFKIPKEIFFLKEIPKTSLGKIDREKLKMIITNKILR
ncbi:MAG: acyl--CoA ligase [Ignavibacterium sp.]|nr:acyl--CoA ligase [Ignavibacterium sp.]MDW8375416.1 class I adenylate-forming enzyme family protein [Ignavibacteriales bacterium]